MITKNRRAGIGLFVLLFCLGQGLAWAKADLELEKAVSARLRAQESLRDLPIGLEVSGRTVRLLGEVRTLAQKEEAGREAGKVRGVRQVVNEIEVARSNEKDLHLTRKVADEILYYPRYTMFDSVGVEVEDGVALLGGYVTQPWKKTEMENRAKKVEGVREMRNRIEVLPVSLFDEELRYRIARILYRDARYADLASRYPSPLHFVVKNSRVSIEGVVLSEVDRRAIGSLVRQGTLALSVTNNLKTEIGAETVER